jgi:hypothetical protein
MPLRKDYEVFASMSSRSSKFPRTERMIPAEDFGYIERPSACGCYCSGVVDPAVHQRMNLRILVCLFACVAAGCDKTGTPSQHSALDDFARQYVRLAVALGERDPDALDYYAGPEEQVSDIRRNPPKLPGIQQSATDLAGRLAALPGLQGDDRERRQFLLGQLRAIAARADFLSRLKVSQVRPSFDREVETFFGVRLAPLANGQLDAVRRELAKLLGGTGRLVDRYASFEKRFLIPKERVPQVMARSLQLCREQTLAHVQLPPGESVSVEYVRDKPWSAYSYYKGHYHSVIDINADFGLTVDRALQLACHEGYPGHHAFNSLTEQNLALAKRQAEWLVQPTFSPQSFLSEASATVAGELAFPEAERIHIEEDVLFPLAGLKSADVRNYLKIERMVDALHPAELAIAREYLDDRLDFARAATALEDEALMGHTEAALRYLNEYRSYVVTYTEGRDRVSRWIDARAARSEDPRDRWRPFAELMTAPGLFSQPQH